jgi:hypothetical protein
MTCVCAAVSAEARYSSGNKRDLHSTVRCWGKVRTLSLDLMVFCSAVVYCLSTCLKVKCHCTYRSSADKSRNGKKRYGTLIVSRLITALITAQLVSKHYNLTAVQFPFC